MQIFAQVMIQDDVVVRDIFHQIDSEVTMETKITDLGVDGPDASEPLAIGGVHVGGLSTVEVFNAKEFMGKIDMTNTLYAARVWKTKHFRDRGILLIID